MKTYTPFCDPQDEFELRLAVHESFTQAEEIFFTGPSHSCDLCGVSFENKRFMLDACLDDEKNAWGCICSKCFIKYALKMGPGKGQMFTHLQSGEWLLTAGYDQ